jgi:selenocysteine-specific elongation factor
MIVATAGHIDHGKTLLVKTLTGVDTDRLPEEKARGISIDLGFAYWPVEDGTVIGFVDVPGHERFIRNMLAGVCGIDFALLIVAADDGVMPQTIEHLNILDLLDIRRGIAVVTKIDRVAEHRAQEVVSEVAARLAGTGLAGSPVMPVSAVSGAGIVPLRAALKAAAAACSARATEGQYFRLAIDRAFTITGSGTVVTGTVFNGTVGAGDRLVVSPRGTPVRVRSIQMHGTPAERARAGQRCALNLTGTDVDTVSRGDWLLDPAIHAPTERLDVRVTVLPAEARALKHWTPLHVHLATADVTARIAVPRGATIEAGRSALAQLALDAPVGALLGDRFILRDQSARRTLGGGVVIDPHPRALRRAAAARHAELAALERGSPEQALAGLLATLEQGVDLGRFERTFNLKAERAAALYAAAGMAVLGRENRVGIPEARRAELRSRIPEAVREFHRAEPRAAGLELEALRARLAPGFPLEAFQSLTRELAGERAIEMSGTLVRLPGHDATSNPQDEALWQAVLPALEQAGAAAPTLAELAQQLQRDERTLRDFLHRKSRTRDVLRVTAQRFYARATLAALGATADALARGSPGGTFTAAQYRDATGVGRGLAIEILEFLDTLGVTQRVGDARKIRKDYAAILGPATPLRAPAGGTADKAPQAARPSPRKAARRHPNSR